MKKLILIALLSALSLSLFAQNWFPVNRKGVNYYEGGGNNGTGNIFSGYITDSTTINNEKFYTTQKNLQENREPFVHCIVSDKYSWFGKKMKVISDTSAVFYTAIDSPFMLLLNTSIGKNWVAYTNKNARYTLTHTKTEVLTILGESDSVKTFTITARDTAGKLMPDDYYASIQIQLSKNHGLVNTVNFFSFDDYYATWPRYVPVLFELKGNSTVNTGIKNINIDDVFDMNTGDVFHHIEFNSSLLGVPTNPVLTADTSKIILQVIAKTNSVDSFFFTFARRKATTLLKNKIGSSSLTVDTIQKAYSKADYRFLNHEPGTTEDSIYGNYIHVLALGYRNNLEYKKTTFYDLVTKENDTCFSILIDGSSPTLTYIKGAGPYYEHGGGNGWEWSSQGTRLVYYKKGSQTWGNPWPENVGVKEALMKEMNIHVYPNPVKNALTLINNNSHSLVLKLYSIKGELLIEQIMIPGETLVNMENLQSGLYFYSILGEGNIVNQKLVKE